MLKLTFALAFLVQPACVPLEDQGEIGSNGNAIESMNAMSMNAMSMNAMSMNAMSMNAMSVGRTLAGGIALDLDTAGDLLSSSEGVQLLAYIARCALPEGEQLVVLKHKKPKNNGDDQIVYAFGGRIGLAPEWESGPLSESGQRWMTACLLAHVNAFGIPVPISLRGPHPALGTTSEELQDFPVQEAAFYGNLFADTTGDGIPDPAMFGCHGRALPQYTDAAYLDDRVCGEPDPNMAGWTQCGFVDVGDCDSSWGGTSWACEHPAGAQGGFHACHSEARTATTTWTDTNPYAEVVTVYLMAD